MDVATTRQSSSPPPLVDRSLEDLAAYSAAELRELYEKATVPKSMRVLDGAFCGRLLAPAGPGAFLFAGLVRRLAGSRYFPWLGKTIAIADDSGGTGKNSLSLGLRMDKVPFVIRFDDSVVDGKRCIVLDYDLEENPGVVRRIGDELREVCPGLFMGPFILRPFGIIGWWALDARRGIAR